MFSTQPKSIQNELIVTTLAGKLFQLLVVFTVKNWHGKSTLHVVYKNL